MKRERPRARAGRIPPRAPDRETGSCARGYAHGREGGRAYARDRARAYSRDRARAHVCDRARGRAHDRDDGDRGCGPPYVSAPAHLRGLDHVCGRVRLARAHEHAARDRGLAAECFYVRVCVRPPLGSLAFWFGPAPS